MAHNRFFPARSLLLATCAVALVAMPVLADTLQDAGKLLKHGQHAQSLEQIDKYLSGKPKDAQGRFLKGLILTEMNKPNDAVVVFTKLTEDYPELPEPYNNLAVIYAQQKQYEKAKQALEMAIRTHPSYATAHENLGDIYARLASQAYDKALQIDSSNSSAQTKLSSIKDLISVNQQRPAAGRPAAAKPPVAVVAAAPVEAPKPVEAKPVEPKPVEVPKPVDVKPVEAKVVAAPPPVAPPPAATPAPAKAAEPAKPAASDDAAATAQVTKAIGAWFAAWSKKDVKGYLSHYAKNFDAPGGESRASWEAERAKRISKPATIQVSHENLRVSVDGDTATAKFRQHYKAGSFKTSANKVVTFVRRDGRWLIQQEKIGS